MKNIVRQSILESIRIKEDILRQDIVLIVKMASLVEKTLRRGGKVLFCGNGGSAADSQHLAAELVGRFQKERRAFAAIALTTDTSILTALGNDYGYGTVFARQVEALAKKGDLLIGISTSGNSLNVIKAVKQAKKMELKTISLTGCRGGKLARLTDISFVVPSENTARIQEAQISVSHIICDLVERNLS